MSLFGDYFKILRKKYHKTLRLFCKENNLDESKISKIERGIFIPKNDEINKLYYCLNNKVNQNELITLIELSKINDSKTLKNMKPDEVSREIRDVYLENLIDGNNINLDIARKIVEKIWSE